MFEISCLEQDDERMGKFKDRKMIMSNSNSPDYDTSNYLMIASTEMRRNERKASDVIEPELETSLMDYRKTKKPSTNTNINIFEETYTKK